MRCLLRISLCAPDSSCIRRNRQVQKGDSGGRTDKMSAITDYTDRTTCTLFGDAAGAVLLEPTYEEFGVMDYIFKTDGSGRNTFT
jgi:hypothetical protein